MFMSSEGKKQWKSYKISGQTSSVPSSIISTFHREWDALEIAWFSVYPALDVRMFI